MNFSLKFSLTILTFFIASFAISTNTYAADGYYYQLKLYHFKNQSQADRTEQYLQNAYVPALHKLGIKNVGVFKPVEGDTLGIRLYVLIPFRNYHESETIDQKLAKDADYLNAGKDYIDAAYDNAPYDRLEIILLKAFPKMLEPAVPNLTSKKEERVYELRSYESPTEKLNINKVAMFNDGDEVALFKRLNFNAAFYSEVIAGSHMPNLMYMTCFNNKADREKHWEAFVNDPHWKSLIADPIYQHNVSKNTIVFLHPAVYSDF